MNSNPGPPSNAIGRLRATAEAAYSEAERSAEGGTVIRELLDLTLTRLDALAAAEAEPRPLPLAVDTAGLPPPLADFPEALATRDPAVVAAGAAKIAKWAEEEGLLKTAAFYAELAASYNPRDAMLLYSAGRLFRRLADFDAAEAWYNRAIDQGTENDDWLAVGLAWSGLGNVQRQVGRAADAAASHTASLLVARQHSIRTLEGDAYHNLAVLAFEQGNADEGVSHARKALDGYADRQQRLLALANDLAWVWMTHDGAFSRALPVFQKVLARIDVPAYQLVVLGNVARAAGGAGDRAEFERARQRLEELLQSVTWGESHAAALVEMAHGACSLGSFEVAAAAAQRALETAQQREEAAVAAEAADMLEYARRRERIEAKRHEPGRPSRLEQQLDELALELIQAIS